MRLWLKLTLSIVAFFAAVLVAGYCFLCVYGERIFNEQASQLTKRKVTVTRILTKFPSTCVLQGLKIEGVASVKQTAITVDMLSLFSKDISLTNVDLIAPVIFVERKESGAIAAPASAAAPTEGLTAAAPSAGKRSVLLKSLKIHAGELRIKELAKKKEYVVEDINADLHNVSLTGDAVKTDFFVSASLSKLNAPFIGHFLTAKGWLNWTARDMEASAQTVDDDGRVNLDAQLSSRANAMSVKGNMRLSGLQQKQASGDRAGVVENIVLGVLDATSTDIEARFSFSTRMDQFDIGQMVLSGNIMTGLNSSGSSGNIVESLKAVGEEILKSDAQ